MKRLTMPCAVLCLIPVSDSISRKDFCISLKDKTLWRCEAVVSRRTCGGAMVEEISFDEAGVMCCAQLGVRWLNICSYYISVTSYWLFTGHFCIHRFLRLVTSNHTCNHINKRQLRQLHHHHHRRERIQIGYFDWNKVEDWIRNLMWKGMNWLRGVDRIIG